MAGPNLLFRADPPLVEAFKRHFDWSWGNSRPITARGVADIPDLVIPDGTLEGARLWQNYLHVCTDAEIFDDTPRTIAQVDPPTGDVTLETEDGQPIVPPTEELGLAKLDVLAERIARLYDKGALISIDKLSRIPPLDAPLDPSLFGDFTELHRGSVTRKISMRVSIIDEKTLKEIEKRRQGLRTLLTRFTHALADNMRWMPTTAQTLFEQELKRIDEEGKSLVQALLKGDVDAFIQGKRKALVADVNAMYAQLGRAGYVTDNVIEAVIDSLKARLEKAKSASFMPKLTYSKIIFSKFDNGMISPWGQASSLLIDIATFPRKALTDPFFFRGLNVPGGDLIEAMNVADDALCRNLHARGIKERCKTELEFLSRVEKAPNMQPRTRCELVWHILAGEPYELIGQKLKESAA